MAGSDAAGVAQPGFRWQIPARYNLARHVLDRWALTAPDRPALLVKRGDRPVETVRYGVLAERSRRLAAALARRGVGVGDRVAILLPQSPEVVIAHLAAARIGALGLPLAAIFGPDALAYRLGHSGAKALILDAAGLGKLAAIRADLPGLETVLCVDGAAGEAIGLEAALAAEAADDPGLDTRPDDPAMMIYTSGTTGQPKGAVHAHRVLLGHMPGFRLAHPDLGADELMWTPADWAWAGGLLNALLPSLSIGMPVLAWPHEKFSAEEALELMRETGITRAFLPPTALRIVKAARPEPAPLGLPLRSVMSAGETLGPDSYAWAAAAFGAPVNELYGQTECNLVIGSSWQRGVSSAGRLGKPVPGHDVALLDAKGDPVRPGEPGEIAIRRPDPVMFLRYWQDEAATRQKFSGDRMLTGDQAVVEADGLWRFLGRDDDLITSSGYRIGPGEIEDCLARHPAVAMAAAVGKPDPLRTEIVRAIVVLRPGFAASEALTADIKAFVRQRLSAHEYPREVDYVDSLPLTATGKIIRRALREAR